METIIKKLQGATGICNLTKHIIEYDEYRKASKSAALYQFGISPANRSSLATTTGADHAHLRENAILQQAETYLNDISDKDSHKEHKKKIESALNQLITLYKSRGKELQPKAFILIARAYLLRSIIIRPKGMTVPEKKKEALEKGLFFVNEAINQLTPKAITPVISDLLEEAWRVKGQLCLEYHRVNSGACDENTLKIILHEAISAGCKKLHEKEKDVQFAIKYCELTNSKEYLTQITESPLEGIEFEKARAYKLLGGKGDENHVKDNMDLVIRQLSFFSDPLWDDAVEFIDKLRIDGKEYWKELALSIYDVCKEQEAKTENLHLRWYWSRQRKLYDLAFLAANSPKEKAKVADSIKSRPSLRWSALNAMGKKENQIAALLKDEATAMLGGYIKGIRKIRDKRNPKTGQQHSITNIPKGWIAIHFYANQLEGECHALIYNADTEKWHSGKVIEYKKLYDCFLTWQTNYNLYKELAADHLIQLCEQIGSTMPFLFDENIIPPGKDILMIPHDYLHRLPLHGAIGKDENGNKIVFLEKYPCCYLPAWSFVSDFKESYVNGCILLNNFPKYKKDGGYDFNKLRAIRYWHSDSKMDNASPEDLKTIYPSPELLVILCHGKADGVNPFNAKLELAEGGITHIEILNSVKNIKGSRIILGACETDLVPPLSDVIDEHLSITTAFLTNGVIEILGTMWKVDAEKTVEEVVGQIITEGVIRKPIFQIINSWQIEKLKLWKKKDFKSYIYYDCITLRIYGKGI